MHDGTERKRALVAMSGGVDSSVAARLTVAMGYDCVGCTMLLFDERTPGLTDTSLRTSEDNVRDAGAVCDTLGIPFVMAPLAEEFRNAVILPFAASYLAGETPNPCIICNRCLKFGALYDKARELGCEFVVTGHYARIVREGDRYLLKKAADPSKDQSYVLWSLTQAQLARTLFPLGGMTKTETRALAESWGLVNAHRHDSQDICFVPDGRYARVVEAAAGGPAPAGDFVDGEGRVLGRHRGIIRYTVGQHKGLGLPTAEPLYVTEIRPWDNTVVLGPSAALFRREADVRDVHWISGEAPEGPLRARVKVRYRQKEQWADVIPTGEDTVRLRFDEPQRAITPGQSAVFYDDDIVLGGGILQPGNAGTSGRKDTP